MPLRRKLIVILIILLSLGFGSTSVISYLTARHSLRERIIADELPLTCDNIYSEIQRDLLPPVFISSQMANDAFLRNWVLGGEKNPAQINQYLNEIRNKYHALTSFFVSEKTRLYYHADGILKTVKPDEERDIWYFRVRRMKPDYEINVDPDMAHGDAMSVFINYRVFDFHGNYIGATGVGLRISVVKALIESYHQKYHRTIYFADAKGRIVLHSSADMSFPANVKDIPGLGASAEQILSSKETALEYRRAGKTVYLNARFIPELNWILFAEQTEANAMADIFKTLIYNLLWCGIITIAVIVATCIVLSRHQRKIEAMLKADMELQGVNREQKLQIEQQQQVLISQNAKLTRLNDSKDKLFSIIAHDLRNPIGNFIQLLDILEKALAAGERHRAADLLAKLKTASDSSFKLLENLSEWAVNQISERTSRPETFAVSPLLTETLELLHPATEHKRLSVQTTCPDGLQAYADVNMVRTILRNLISNAVKFTHEKGEVRIDVKTENELIMIAIQDNGIGIDAEKLPELFDFVGNASSFGTAGEKGTGLGLSLCKDLVALNHGEIRVESKVGSGSTFTFSLPRAGV